MTDFEAYTAETLEAPRPLMKNTRKTLSFMANLIGTMAEAPTSAEAKMSVAGTIVQPPRCQRLACWRVYSNEFLATEAFP